MNLVNVLKGLLNLQRKVNVKSLPSQGLFYGDDFEITIKKADIEDIIEYEHNYIKDDLGLVITKLKKIVEKNAIFSTGYSFNDLKSIDIVFLFLEVVRFTKGKAVSLTYFDDEKGQEINIEFSSNYFNYFRIDNDVMKNYNTETKEFTIEDFKFTLPSIGVENCLTNYLISKSDDSDVEKYTNYNYDFIYFLGNKKSITFNEIDNLIQIFNYDIEESDSKKIRKVIKMFQPIQKYSLKKGDKIIEINSKIDLEKIWK
jgi:transposase